MTHLFFKTNDTTVTIVPI